MADYNIPAFPTNHGPFNPDIDGMTLRDYFAAKAMQGAQTSLWFYICWLLSDYDALAERAYEIADAMLKASEKTNG